MRPVKDFLKNNLPKQWMAYVRWKRGYVEPELGWLSRIIQRERISVDVGANIGDYTWPLSQLTPRVHAFEASRELASLLARAVPQNVIVHNVALSDHAGHALLHTPVNNEEGVLTDWRPWKL